MNEYRDYADADSVLDRLEQWDYDDVTDILDASQDSHADRLEDELNRIKHQLEQRDGVHDEITNDLEWKLDRYKDRLKKMRTHGRGRADGERERVKDRINELSGLLREEQRKHWQDKQKLEQERRELDLRVPPARPEDYLPRFADDLDLSGAVVAHARDLVKQARDVNLLVGKGRTGVAAAVLYTASVLEGEKRTQQQVADAVGVTVETLRNRYQELMNGALSRDVAE